MLLIAMQETLKHTPQGKQRIQFKQFDDEGALTSLLPRRRDVPARSAPAPSAPAEPCAQPLLHSSTSQSSTVL